MWLKYLPLATLAYNTFNSTNFRKYNPYELVLSRKQKLLLDQKKTDLEIKISGSYKVYYIIINFLNNKTNIWIWRQAFVSLQYSFLRSEENVVIYNFETPKGVWENVVSCNIWHLIFTKTLFKAQVMPQCYIGRCYAWHMLFAIWDVVYIITTEECVTSSYCL